MATKGSFTTTRVSSATDFATFAQPRINGLSHENFQSNRAFSFQLYYNTNSSLCLPCTFTTRQEGHVSMNKICYVPHPVCKSQSINKAKAGFVQCNMFYHTHLRICADSLQRRKGTASKS
jgi:hypothetical protein